MTNAIEQARQKRRESVNKLYQKFPGFDRFLRVYSEPVHNAKIAAIQESYEADVFAVISDQLSAMAHCKRLIATAESTLANGGKAYDWLSDQELERANRISKFVASDVKDLDPKALVEFVQSAAGNPDKATRWAALRFASERWSSFEDSIDPVTWAGWNKSYPDLRESVAPVEVIEAEQKARANLAQAEKIYEQVRYELPTERRRLSAALGIREDALFPEQAESIEPAGVATDAEIKQWQQGLETLIDMKHPRPAQERPHIDPARIMADARRKTQEQAQESAVDTN